MKNLMIITVGLLFAVQGTAHAKYHLKAKGHYPVSKLSSRKAPGAELFFLRAVDRARKVDRVNGDKLRIEPSFKPQAKTVVMRDGSIHEHGKVYSRVNIATFLKRVDPVKWASKLPGLFAEDAHVIKDVKTKQGTRVVYLRQRMLIGKNPLTRLDMDKDTAVIIKKDGSVSINWTVTDSQRSRATLGRKTVNMDDGYIKFTPTKVNGSDATLITSNSIHNVTTAPSRLLSKMGSTVRNMTNALTARSLRKFWVNTLDSYAKMGELK